MSLLNTVQRGSYDEFLKAYSPADATQLAAGGRPLLFKSVTNPDIDARVAITERLLDDGADPSVVSNGVNVLHVFFGTRVHDAEKEVLMLRRLIEGGADINQVSKRSGPPLAVLIEHGPRPESACLPFYDVIFAQPNLDFTVPYGAGTLRDLIFDSVWNLPLLRERVTVYESTRKQQ